MSARHTAFAWDVGGLSPTAKSTLLAIADSANHVDGRCNLVLQVIMALTGIKSDKTVRKNIKELEDAKLLHRVVTRGGRGGNTYRLTFDESKPQIASPDEEPIEVLLEEAVELIGDSLEPEPDPQETLTITKEPQEVVSRNNTKPPVEHTTQPPVEHTGGPADPELANEDWQPQSGTPTRLDPEWQPTGQAWATTRKKLGDESESAFDRYIKHYTSLPDSDPRAKQRDWDAHYMRYVNHKAKRRVDRLNKERAEK